jgi:hypothetical protein
MKAPPPQDGVSTNSTTCANIDVKLHGAVEVTIPIQGYITHRLQEPTWPIVTNAA